MRVEFDRSIMPLEAYGKPFIAAFFDGRDMAFSGVLYAIWVQLWRLDLWGARPGSRLTGTRTQ